ncbi:hypothetical protein LCGC14_2606130, partial [marine sediment metagenome]
FKLFAVFTIEILNLHITPSRCIYLFILIGVVLAVNDTIQNIQNALFLLTPITLREWIYKLSGEEGFKVRIDSLPNIVNFFFRIS